MSLDLLVFQGTGGCNLDCAYCYLPKAARRDHQLMDLDLLETAARKCLSSSLLGQTVTVLWHAGEPLLVGHDWMEQALAILDRANVHGRNLLHTVQTNATLIDDRWCEIFKRHNIRVGVSCDGPAPLHDAKRVNWGGRGSFAKTMRGVRLLKAHGLGYIAISVITAETLAHPDAFYDFMVEEGFESVGLNIEEIEGFNATSSLGPAGGAEDAYRRFLDRLCDRWMASDALAIREFDVVSAKMVTARTRPNYYPMQNVSQGMKILTIRADGALITFAPELASGTPEDGDRFVVGNIRDIEDLDEVFAAPTYRTMKREIARGIARCRDECEHFPVCGGGWSSNKYFETGSFDATETLSCRRSVKDVHAVLGRKIGGTAAFEESIRDYMAARAR